MSARKHQRQPHHSSPWQPDGMYGVRDDPQWLYMGIVLLAVLAVIWLFLGDAAEHERNSRERDALLRMRRPQRSAPPSSDHTTLRRAVTTHRTVILRGNDPALSDSDDLTSSLSSAELAKLQQSANSVVAALDSLVRRPDNEVDDSHIAVRGREKVLEVQEEAAARDARRAEEEEPRIRGRPGGDHYLDVHDDNDRRAQQRKNDAHAADLHEALSGWQKVKANTGEGEKGEDLDDTVLRQNSDDLQ